MTVFGGHEIGEPAQPLRLFIHGQRFQSARAAEQVYNRFEATAANRDAGLRRTVVTDRRRVHVISTTEERHCNHSVRCSELMQAWNEG